MDCEVVPPEGDGVVVVRFTMPHARPTTRTFKDMRSATVFAVFVAAQTGTRRPDQLAPWLRQRGFDADLATEE